MTVADRAPDRRVIQCNYAESVSPVAEGARAYVVNPNRGHGYERIYLCVRSRGGRWIWKWEHARRLRDFRAKTIPPEHSLYAQADRFCPADSQWGAEFLAAMAER